MRSLALKLILAFLAISLTVTVLVAVFIRQSSQAAFANYVWNQQQNKYIADTTAYYQTRGSWDGVADHFFRLLKARPPQPGTPDPLPPPFVLLDRQGYVLVPAPPYRIGDRVPREKVEQGVPIEADGRIVGTVVATGVPPDRDPTEERYLARTDQALLAAGLGATGVALVLGILLAHTLTRPLRELTSATRAVSRGELEQQVPVRSQDELGELAASFNQMSADLAQAVEQRRQMTADIAHDLRTPLTVIAGYLESLRDGVLQPSRERFEVLCDEARHLQHLVEDLRTLSLADAGELALHRQPVAPRELLERAAVGFRHRAEQHEVTLEVQAEAELPEISVDPERMAQVLGNLISNALRHTQKGGRVVLSARRQPEAVVLAVRDTGAGIAAEVLPRVFDRFYRGDATRQQEGGESGLGLAIAKSLVEIHGGLITAHSDGPGRGSTFSVRLPLQPRESL